MKTSTGNHLLFPVRTRLSHGSDVAALCERRVSMAPGVLRGPGSYRRLGPSALIVQAAGSRSRRGN
ncbi:hypothetical protein EYF80_061865 [Liparis tanakae]|uniref:Uncharacterized protein n=1 Tax=Liparis tanakae TaxID=230148 RepID=A0A4Z2EGU1_9TELE|nr:hypothetical protein EYF80_061865 [Liparis tanakae]